MDEPMVTTTIRVPERVWLALRRLAEIRALEQGGRASASGAVADLVVAETKRLEGAR